MKDYLLNKATMLGIGAMSVLSSCSAPQSLGAYDETDENVIPVEVINTLVNIDYDGTPESVSFEVFGKKNYIFDCECGSDSIMVKDNKDAPLGKVPLSDQLSLKKYSDFLCNGGVPAQRERYVELKPLPF